MSSPVRQWSREEIDASVTDEYARVIGLTITNVRIMTEAEAESWGWENGYPLVVELSNGTFLVPSMDDEGNGGGALFMVDKVEQDDE